MAKVFGLLAALALVFTLFSVGQSIWFGLKIDSLLQSGMLSGDARDLVFASLMKAVIAFFAFMFLSRMAYAFRIASGKA
jgi:hypothetical protein